MQTLTANEAKTQFGDMLLKVQREPVQISRNGKPVAVVISIEEYQHMEMIKRQRLVEKLQRAKGDIANGDMVDGEQFFSELLTGPRD
ncbi:antitoxin [Leminorella grimontii]|uniref:Antitoxin n=1 Tax=Leminorella grimontii TaxID=82981 RepID=A0AAV5N3S6_9GAMM|nr:type II toxin-antitoxin system Phd/YefM family antitoxin [Leminorella grimontii]KFC93518.1 ParD family antitoxin [Leminorella grimontii ATCC 33999 = DSM 5078]GKX55789.1 antitoxin [Leminorella grimontii]GKX59591.1 antitoxin [Leminorella grimontii]VFS55167.1 prevent-host-death family protein [Leminorella grimontii]